jgi:hypothetical protein
MLHRPQKSAYDAPMAIRRWGQLHKREKALLVLLGGVVLVAAYRMRPWMADRRLTSEHYQIESTATEEQTREILAIAEMVYQSYDELFSDLPDYDRSHAKLKMRLYQDRDEFKRQHPYNGWAEALYKAPYCYQYYSADEANPYHWMTHEATHQLNWEVAGLNLPRWLNEGVADYFGTSLIKDGTLQLGRIDKNTYPIWWLNTLGLSGDMAKDIQRNRLIPLRTIIEDQGGPDIDQFVNLYYVHWWSLAHFLFHYEDGKYRSAIRPLLLARGTVEAFEKHVGDIETIQKQWYHYLWRRKYNDATSKSGPQ